MKARAAFGSAIAGFRAFQASRGLRKKISGGRKSTRHRNNIKTKINDLRNVPRDAFRLNTGDKFTRGLGVGALAGGTGGAITGGIKGYEANGVEGAFQGALAGGTLGALFGSVTGGSAGTFANSFTAATVSGAVGVASAAQADKFINSFVDNIDKSQL